MKSYENLTKQDWALFRAMLLLTETGNTKALTSLEYARLCIRLHSRLGDANIVRMRGELR